MLVCSVGNLQQKQTVESSVKNDREKRLDEQREAGKRAIEEARLRVAATPDSAEARLDLAETLLKGPITAEDYDTFQTSRRVESQLYHGARWHWNCAYQSG